MYKNKRILALITARGGSKGIPGKNIKPLGGEPLIKWTIDAAKASCYVDRLILSTDSVEVANVANAFGCEVPFMRPDELATDAATSMDVIMHALDMLHDEYDYLLLLQPTSPFRKACHIDEIIQQGIDSESLMTISVTESKKHPAFMYTTLSNNILSSVLSDPEQKRRQDMPKVYEHNGALYFSEISYLKEVKNYNSEGVVAYFMDSLSSMDLDTQIDWVIAECMVEKEIINAVI